MDDAFGIAAFRSRQQVLSFERLLRGMGLNVTVVSTPRDVAIGCGLSVRFEIADARVVMAALDRAQTGNLIGLYRVDRVEGRNRLTVLSVR